MLVTTLGDVHAVLVPPLDETLLAERRRLGHDRHDEMWEGVLHMVPPPNSGHQRHEANLLVRLTPFAAPLGLEVLAETGLFDPDVPDGSSFRVPDVVVGHPDSISDRGVEGRAVLAFEIRSPRDETYQKLGFYGRVGVDTLLVVDDRLGTLERFVNRDGVLVLAAAEPDGWVSVDALGVGLRLEAGRIEVHETGAT